MKLIQHIKNSVLGGIVSGAVVTASVVAFPLLTSTSAFAASEAADNLVAVKRLNELLANTKSMTANFTQTTSGASRSGKTLSGNGTFSGSMSVQRPAKFRWETKKPTEQLVVASGNTLWVYDKDLEQVTKQSVNNQVGNTPALLLSGDPNTISKSFKITQPNDDKNYYVLYPTASDSSFKSLSLSFNGGKPVMMVLNDSLGQTTSIKFSNIKLNGKIAASQFQFTPPKDVDVIEQ